MEKSSRFVSAFMNTSVKSGKRISTSINPEVTLQSTKDKFVVNDVARDIMGIKGGDYITVLDRFDATAKTPIPQIERYAFATNYKDSDGNVMGSKLDDRGGFSYAGVYSSILLDDPKVKHCTFPNLEEADLVVSHERTNGTLAYISKFKVVLGIEPMVDEDGDVVSNVQLDDDGGEAEGIFIVTSITRVDHTPQIAK